MQMFCVLTILCSHCIMYLADITRIIVYDLYVCPYQVLMYEYIYFTQKVQQMYTFFFN